MFHLAGFSSVRESFKFPDLCRQINVQGTKNLFEALRKLKLKPRVLVVGSSDTYKADLKNKLTETSPLESQSPYGKSRIEQEEYLKTVTDIDWIQTRSFPHIGPGQRQGFVTADFASQIAAEASGSTIKVGDLSAVRDFSHVKDVVRAYRLLLESKVSHDVFNICSGEGHSIQAVLDCLISISKKDIKVVIDSDLIRPTEIIYSVGDNSKLKSVINWGIENTFEETLKEIYISWVNKGK